jgi:hypothetical protein
MAMRFLLQDGAGEFDSLLNPGDLLTGVLVGNVILVLFNMLPAFPSDGGRVLRALLATVVDRLKATQIAATIGAVFAFLFAFLGLFNQMYMLAVVGLFLFLAGQQELAYVRYQAGRKRALVQAGGADVLDVEPVTVEPAFTGVAWDQDRRVWVLWQNGRPVRTYWMPGSQG